VTFFRPSAKIACASTVAVVVPSPATSEVLVATSLTIWAPMFSIGSFSSISLATETPSLVTVGAPNFRSSTTFRPFGPSVTFTAWASWSTPDFSRARASTSKSSSFAAIRRFSYRRSSSSGALRKDREDVRLPEDQVLHAVHGHVGPAVLPVQDHVTGLHVRREARAVLGEPPGADGDHLALGRLLLRRVGDVEPAAHLLAFLGRLDDDAVRERLDLGSTLPFSHQASSWVLGPFMGTHPCVSSGVARVLRQRVNVTGARGMAGGGGRSALGAERLQAGDPVETDGRVDDAVREGRLDPVAEVAQRLEGGPGLGVRA